MPGEKPSFYAELGREGGVAFQEFVLREFPWVAQHVFLASQHILLNLGLDQHNLVFPGPKRVEAQVDEYLMPILLEGLAGADKSGGVRREETERRANAAFGYCLGVLAEQSPHARLALYKLRDHARASVRQGAALGMLYLGERVEDMRLDAVRDLVQGGLLDELPEITLRKVLGSVELVATRDEGVKSALDVYLAQRSE